MQGSWEPLFKLPKQYQGEKPATAAVLVPLYEDPAGEIRVVITKRPDHMPSHPGQLAFPGGKIDREDASPLAAALREADEEVGIRPEDVDVCGFLEPVHTNLLDMIVAPVVGRLPGPPQLVLQPEEVELSLEPPLEYFFDEGLWRSELWSGFELWFIEVQGEVLWGASARIMRSMLEVIKGR